ncbi:MAG: efflux RND transporter periplasmic adaptor subunit [Victivallales bacterium]|nr:efflux RND transporter periplasmic adaptor subunit [Victivallales bacterium]
MPSTLIPVLIVSSLALSGCGEDDSQRKDSPQAVRVTQVRQANVVQGRSYLAEVVSTSTVRVLAQVQGTVSALPVDEGGRAGEGDVLARLAAPDVMARLNRVRADRERAERERDFACGRTKTDRLLLQAGDIAPDQLDASEKNCSTGRLAASAAQAAEDEVSAISARSAERAPFEGIVLERLTELGQTVMPGMPLVLYGSTERELLLRVPASDLTSELGQGTSAVFDGGRGTVTSVGGWAKGPAQLVELRVTVEQPHRLPTVGSTTSVKLVLDEQAGASAVPLDALGSDSLGSYLLLVQGDRLDRYDVTRGPHEDGWVAVEPPLSPGSLVVVGQLDKLDMDRTVLTVEMGS